jgi:diguanylate cyclase
VFAPPMAEDQREQASLLADLRVAAGLGQFELVYQPKVAAGSLQVTGVEALLRWHHPLRGIVSPAVFIPMAERSGLIGGIGDWVMADACRQCAAWRAQGLHLPVAINLSAYQMRQHDLADRVDAALQRHGLQAGDLTLEITESVAVEDTDIIRRSFERLSDLGVQVSVDDYGVGQTSLGSLQQLLVSELKVDASLVRDLADRPDVRGIVDAMVRLAHALSLKVVAMGVETEAQRDRLVQLGCDELQGFLFAKPMSAPGVAQLARRDPVAVPRAVAGSVTQCSDSTAAVDLTG